MWIVGTPPLTYLNKGRKIKAEEDSVTFQFCRIIGHFHFCFFPIRLVGGVWLGIHGVHFNRAKVPQELHGIKPLPAAFEALQDLEALVRFQLAHVFLQKKQVEAHVVVVFRFDFENVKRRQKLIDLKDVRALPERDEEGIDHQWCDQHVDDEIDIAQQLEDPDGNHFALKPFWNGRVIF